MNGDRLARPALRWAAQGSWGEQMQVTGVAPAAVNCPTDAKQGKGNDFQCAAIVEGQTVTVNVTQTDDSGHVTFATADAMLHRTDVEQPGR